MTDDSNAEADALIEGYKQVLTREAELARGDLDEIEDHLRALTDELRGSGMPRVAAVREACRRLGDPRAVAREHARVRSPFGARLSRLRAYSAVALMLPPLISGALEVFPSIGVFSVFGLQIVFGAVVAFAVALRLTWARPIVLGAIACFVIQLAYTQYVLPDRDPIWLVLYTGILAFVLPWRRVELSASGIALALQVFAFGGAAYALEFQFSTPSGFQPMSTGAHVAFYATVIATAGGILRARWGALASLFSAATLAIAFFELAPLNFRFAPGAQAVFVTLLGGAVLAALAGALLSWRTARSNLGTLEHVLA